MSATDNGEVLARRLMRESEVLARRVVGEAQPGWPTVPAIFVEAIGNVIADLTSELGRATNELQDLPPRAAEVVLGISAYALLMRDVAIEASR